MIQRITALFSFLSLLAMVAHAQIQEVEINLNEKNGYTDTTALRDAADLYVTAIPDNSNEKAQIKLEIKNQTEKYGLLLFDKSYTEKDTKSKDWKNEFFEINWENTLKNKGPVEATNDLTQQVFFIDLSETCTLPIQKIIDNSGAEVNLAIYLCEIQKRNKTHKPTKVKMKYDEIHPIKINLELGPDTEFEQLSLECETFIKKTINNWSFCPCEGGSNCKMKKHHPNLDGQIKNLEHEVNIKKKHISDIAGNHGILVREAIKDTKYQPLMDDLDQAFKAKVEDVFNHPEKLKKCEHCSPPLPHKRCDTCQKPLGQGSNQCTGHHCSKCGLKIGGKEPRCHCGDITWKKALEKFEAIYRELKNKKITCKAAKSKASSIYNRVKDKPDDGFKEPAKRSYDNIKKKCK